MQLLQPGVCAWPYDEYWATCYSQACVRGPMISTGLYATARHVCVAL